MHKSRIILNNNNKVTLCEKVNCSAYATNRIKVNVKNIGSITLLLCDQCKFLFSEMGEKG